MINMTNDSLVTTEERKMIRDLRIMKQDQEMFERSLVRAVQGGINWKSLDVFTSRVKENHDAILEIETELTLKGYDVEQMITQW